MKALFTATIMAALCCGCVTQTDNTELDALKCRIDSLENRILELDRDVAYLFDERIKNLEEHVNTIDNERK